VEPVRLLIVSDIHSNFEALETVIEKAGDFDLAICAGDIVGYGPDPGDCVETLKRLKFRSVSGNHDLGVTTGEGSVSHFNVHAARAVNINRRLLNQDQMQWLGKLPKSLELDIEGARVSVYHGSPSRPTWEYVFPTEAEARAGEFFETTGADIIILGHTHVPHTHRTEDALLLNPGSVGQPRDGDPRASYMLVYIEDGETEVRHGRAEYDIDIVMERMRRLDLPAPMVTRLKHGR